MNDLIIAFLSKAQFAVMWAAIDEQYTHCTDWLPESKEAVASIHLFDSRETLWEYLLANYEQAEGSWYWVVDLRGEAPACLCCGCCDPYDRESVEEQLFGEDKK